MVKYSILITTYNTVRTVRQSLESVLSQIDDDFEVIVVDNFSSDGTLEYLRELSREGKIRLIVAKCNRGEGRQIALEHAKGKYVIAKVDMDSIYNPVFKDLVEFYVEKEKELGEFVLYAGVIISSRSFLLKVGWRPLQWGENYELYKRLIDMGKLYVCRVRINSDHIKFKQGLLARMKTAFINYRDAFRIGLRFKVILKELWKKHGLVGFLTRFVLLFFAWIVSDLYEKYDTFREVTWEEFYRDHIYDDSLNSFEVYHPDKVLRWLG